MGNLLLVGHGVEIATPQRFFFYTSEGTMFFFDRESFDIIKIISWIVIAIAVFLGAAFWFG